MEKKQFYKDFSIENSSFVRNIRRFQNKSQIFTEGILIRLLRMFSPNVLRKSPLKLLTEERNTYLEAP